MGSIRMLLLSIRCGASLGGGQGIVYLRVWKTVWYQELWTTGWGWQRGLWVIYLGFSDFHVTSFGHRFVMMMDFTCG